MDDPVGRAKFREWLKGTKEGTAVIDCWLELLSHERLQLQRKASVDGLSSGPEERLLSSLYADQFQAYIRQKLVEVASGAFPPLFLPRTSSWRPVT